MTPSTGKKGRKGKKLEITPGGSAILYHRGGESTKTRKGYLGDHTRAWFKQRCIIYEEYFGRDCDVVHETIPLIPHVDVFCFKPGHKGRDYCTLVTGGMSDLAMTPPVYNPEAPTRVELIFYCAEPKREYAAMLGHLAHFPHDNRTALCVGDTMPNYYPPEPLFGSPVLDTFLFLSAMGSDADMWERLSIRGVPVHFLQVVPITTAELNYKLERGAQALCDIFNARRLPMVFDPTRPSYL